jgi:hypothetical protein
MAQAMKGSKRKRSKRAFPLWAAAGVSLATTGIASADAPATDIPSRDSGKSILLAEQEVFDVSLGTFYVFDKENEYGPRVRLAAGRGGCGGCGGHGGGCGGCHAAGCGGCHAGGGCGCHIGGCGGCRGCRGCGGCGCGLGAPLAWGCCLVAAADAVDAVEATDPAGNGARFWAAGSSPVNLTSRRTGGPFVVGLDAFAYRLGLVGHGAPHHPVRCGKWRSGASRPAAAPLRARASYRVKFPTCFPAAIFWETRQINYGISY